MRIDRIDTSDDHFSYENGVRVRYIEDGVSYVTAPLHERTANRWGGAHGGILFTLADVASGCTVVHHYGMACVTVNMTVDFMSAATPGATELIARGRIEKAGGKMAFCTCEISDNLGRHLATTHAVFAVTGQKL